MRRAAAASLALVFLLVTSSSRAQAAGPDDIFRAGDVLHVASTVIVPHDLYFAGQSITIDGTVQGDVAAAGQMVVVNGTIEGDLWAGAQSVTVNGRVRGDLRVGVQSLGLNGEVGRNVLVFGNDASTSGQARVGGDFIAYTASTFIGGEVRGDVAGETASYRRTGAIGGRELIQITPQVERAERERPAPTVGRWALERGQHWLSLILVGGLLILTRRDSLLNAASLAVRRPLASLGTGVLVLVGGLAASIVIIVGLIIVAIITGGLGLGGLTAISVIGLLLSDAALVIGLIFGATFFASVLASLVLGRWLLEGRWQGGALNTWAWLALGAAGYVIAGGVPVVGWLVQLTAALIGLGALGIALWGWWRGRRVASAVEEMAT